VVPAANLIGIRGQYFANNALAGEPTLTRTDSRADFRWTLNSPGRGIPFDWFSARWTGTLTAPADGVRRIGIEGNDGYRLWIDDTLVIHHWGKRSYGPRRVYVGLAPGRVRAPGLALATFGGSWTARPER